MTKELAAAEINKYVEMMSAQYAEGRDIEEEDRSHIRAGARKRVDEPTRDQTRACPIRCQDMPQSDNGSARLGTLVSGPDRGKHTPSGTGTCLGPAEEAVSYPDSGYAPVATAWAPPEDPT